ncbi:MAG: hypothetical protein CMN94_08600 [Synechococcus sp. EAC657]|nr:hypothetical protein [Synechococcus sp. EAC657]
MARLFAGALQGFHGFTGLDEAQWAWCLAFRLPVYGLFLISRKTIHTAVIGVEENVENLQNPLQEQWLVFHSPEESRIRTAEKTRFFTELTGWGKVAWPHGGWFASVFHGLRTTFFVVFRRRFASWYGALAGCLV